MSAIDHKETSERIMRDLGENFIALEGQTDATMIATAIDALREATLYAGEQTAELAKQQRIANLIAVTAWNDTALRQDVPTRRINGEVPDYTSERARVDRWFAEVRKGLNIS